MPHHALFRSKSIRRATLSPFKISIEATYDDFVPFGGGRRGALVRMAWFPKMSSWGNVQLSAQNLTCRLGTIPQAIRELL